MTKGEIGKVTLLLLIAACAGQGVTTTTPATTTTITESPLPAVPNVVGSDEAFARGVIFGAGFAVEVSQRDVSGEPGVVAQQLPPAGSLAETTTVVTLIVPEPPPASRTTTTTVNIEDEIVEQLRRFDAESQEDIGVSGFIGLRTDRQLLTLVDRICREIASNVEPGASHERRRQGITQTWNDLVGAIEFSLQGAGDFGAWLSLFTVAIDNRCPAFQRGWTLFLEELKEQGFG